MDEVGKETGASVILDPEQATLWWQGARRIHLKNVAIDALQSARDFKEAGMDAKHAEALASVILRTTAFSQESQVTKSDLNAALHELETRMAKLILTSIVGRIALTTGRTVTPDRLL